MFIKIKKIFTISILFIVTISFTGCLNLLTPKSNNVDPAVTPNRNDHQGVFKTIDGGVSWEHKIKMEEKNEEKTEGDGEGAEIVKEETILDKIKIASLKIDPQNNQVIYLGTVAEGLFKTENGANSWSKVGDENGILDEKATVYSIAVEKGNSDIIYIATLNYKRGELLKSEDGGRSWKASYISSEIGKQINQVQIDPIHRNIVYIATEQGGLIRSDNRGETWYTLSWFKAGIKDFVIDFQNTDGIIVRTNTEILKSIDAGVEWEILNKIINTTLQLKIAIAQISTMTIDNKNPLVVYITYNNLILVTRDGGMTWDKMNTITPALTIVGTAPKVKQIGMIDDTIYYGAGNVFYKSKDKGISWSSHDIPIKGDIRYTENDYSDLSIIYLGAFYDPPPKKR